MKGLPFPSLPQPSQQGGEGLRVALRSAPQAMTRLEWGHPPEDVEPFLMFAECGDTKRLSPSYPDPAKARMLRKLRLVFKRQDVAFPQAAQFFLTAGETSPPQQPGPADRRS